MIQEKGASILEKIRKDHPLVHNITNQVVMNFTANGLLAFGGSPIMAKEREEMTSIASIADGVLINIGTALKNEVPSMLIAAETANQRDIPVVLDPVGVAATPFRLETVRQLLDKVPFTVIKGNAGEMARLVDIPWQTKGVESADDHIDKLSMIAKKVAHKYDTIAVITGKNDVICQDDHIRTNESGHHYLTKITGAGCLLGSIITASLSTGSLFKPIDHVHTAVHFYGKAAERAVKHQSVKGTGTFIPHFIDELARDFIKENSN